VYVDMCILCIHVNFYDFVCVYVHLYVCMYICMVTHMYIHKFFLFLFKFVCFCVSWSYGILFKFMKFILKFVIFVHRDMCVCFRVPFQISQIGLVVRIPNDDLAINVDNLWILCGLFRPFFFLTSGEILWKNQ
jgi:hypothetical protein